jgi:Mlc titration factor MtfA (ptsG expression regulator)
MFGFFRRRRRRAIREREFPREWRQVVERNVAAFGALGSAQQAELLGHALVLLEEKNWEGCGGLVLTDEVRVTIAAEAARLLLGRETEYFPTVRSILVYPGTITEPLDAHFGHEAAGEDLRHSAGIATGRLGAILLSWDAVQHGSAVHDDASNVVLHEFAHELDYQDGAFDGAPRLGSSARYRAWAGALQPEFDQHQAAVEAGRKTMLDAYGATNPAEFFAVLTETFFERPAKLRAEHPALYEQLRDFYRQDPG